MSNTLTGRDIYLRHTNTGGASWVCEHRVWDAEKFIASQAAAAVALNAEVKGEAPRRARVEQITREQYLNERTTS
jgi:hypothetical protein